MSETMTKDKDGSAAAPAGGAASGRTAAIQIPVDAAAWWEQHDQRVYQCIKIWVEKWWETESHGLHAAVGEIFGEHRASIRTTATGLSERIARLETASNYEERFARLAYEAKREPEIPQGELLAKIESLQRQVDGNRVANLDARFRELAERVGELEKSNSLEARLTKIANDAKGGPEIPQSELLAKIETLQRELDDLKKVAAQEGPQGPPGPPGKLPLVREYVSEHVHYEADVVTHAGALWQAQCDTVHAPPHDDWTCLARAGHDALTPIVRGTYEAYGKYKKLDVVACDGAAFVAKRDNPGVCPGDGWQLMSRQGKPGRRGESGERGPRGEKGERGEPGVALRSWQLDREHYRVIPLMSDGAVGPAMELRPMFEYFLLEVGGGYSEAE